LENLGPMWLCHTHVWRKAADHVCKRGKSNATRVKKYKKKHWGDAKTCPTGDKHRKENRVPKKKDLRRGIRDLKK